MKITSLSHLCRALVPLLCLSVCSVSDAQVVPPKDVPAFPHERFADPTFWMEQFLGPVQETDAEVLENIPITADEEAEFGERAANAFLHELKAKRIQVVSRGRDVAYLKKLVVPIRLQMKNQARYPKIRVYVADAPFPEAKCFPGGTLVFFRGLLDQAPSEAALVGVIGHELSHLDHGHQLRIPRQMKLAQQTFGGKNTASAETFFRSGTLLVRAFLRPFRPEEEAQADQDGAKWAYAIGYDPRELAALLLTLHRRDAGSRDVLPGFLRTHPYPLDRYRSVMGTYDQLQATSPKADLYIGRENLRQRIPRSERRFP
jgi:predicted Zn-dependent protease